MNWGFCSLAFRHDDLIEVIRKAADLGFDEIEIIAKHLDGKTDAELKSIRRVASESGIRISGISPYFWLTQNESLLAESMEIAKRSIDAARLLDARMIRTFTDAGPTSIGSEVATANQWQTAVQSLQTITGLAPDLIFALETHEKTLADTPDSCERLLQEVARDNLKLTYQPFKTGHAVEDFLRLQPAIRQIHLNPHILPDQPADLAHCGIPYADLLQCLHDHEYPHACAIEFCVPNEVDWDTVAQTLDWCRQVASAK